MQPLKRDAYLITENREKKKNQLLLL